MQVLFSNYVHFSYVFIIFIFWCNKLWNICWGPEIQDKVNTYVNAIASGQLTDTEARVTESSLQIFIIGYF